MIIQGVFHHENVGDETLNKSLNGIFSSNILLSMASIKDEKESHSVFGEEKWVIVNVPQ